MTRTIRLFCLLLAVPSVGAAQQPATRFSLSAGPSRYDLGLAGSGTSFVIAGRTDIMQSPFLVIEPGVTFFTYENSLGRRTSILLPELSLQFQAPFRVVRPYLGGGVGFSSYTSGPNQNELTLHAVSGLRFRFAGSWGLRTEFRVRTIDPWEGYNADLTLGVSRLTSGM